MKRLSMNFLKWVSISSLCIYFGFMIGKFKQDILEHQLQLLELDTSSLNTENTELIEKLAVIQNEKLAEQQLHDGLESENKRLNEALDASNHKLYFYEKVVAPELAEEGLNVYSFIITRAAEKNTWLYELVLIQAQKGRSDLTGKIDIIFTDSFESEAKTIKLSEIDPNFSGNFQFEYFQTLKGSFTLPKTRKMEQMFLVAESSATRWKRAQRVEKIYDWKDFVENNKSSLEELATQAE